MGYFMCASGAGPDCLHADCLWKRGFTRTPNREDHVFMHATASNIYAGTVICAPFSSSRKSTQALLAGMYSWTLIRRRVPAKSVRTVQYYHGTHQSQRWSAKHLHPPHLPLRTDHVSKALNTVPLAVAVIVSQRSNAVARMTRQLKVAAETCTDDSDYVHTSVFWRSVRKIAEKRAGQNEFGIPVNHNDPPRQPEFRHINIRALIKNVPYLRRAPAEPLAGSLPAEWHSEDRGAMRYGCCAWTQNAASAVRVPVCS